LGINDVEKAKRSAFGAAAMFLVSFVVCVVYLIGEGRRTSAIIRRSQLTSTAAIQMISGSRRYGQQTNRFGEYTTVSFSDDVVDGNDNNDLHYA
jgi:dolichol kinase